MNAIATAGIGVGIILSIIMNRYRLFDRIMDSLIDRLQSML